MTAGEDSQDVKIATFIAETKATLNALLLTTTDLKQDNREIRAKVENHGAAFQDFKSDQMQFRTEIKTTMKTWGIILALVGPTIIGFIIKFIQFAPLAK